MTRARRRFSLLEIVIAVGILVIALMATMALLIRSQDLQRISTEHAKARSIV